MADEPFQTTSRDIKTAVPVDTTEMPIRKMDWKRIYRKVHAIPRRSKFYVTASGVAWGIGTSALLSLIPLYQAQSVEPWVKPAYWILGIAFFFVGTVLYWFGTQRETIIESSCEEVERDMRDIHKTFFPDEDINS
jgi:hypothetical protein